VRFVAISWARAPQLGIEQPEPDSVAATIVYTCPRHGPCLLHHLMWDARANETRWIAVLVGVAATACAPVGDHCGARCANPPDGSVDSAADAATVLPTSCKDAFQRGVVVDGVVTIDPDGDAGNPSFDVYCDMTTAGGGWTLAWSYGFTNYPSFTNTNNAIAPRPSWGLPATNGTNVSTTIPTAPTMLGAMDFARWQDIGSEILVTSTINQWISCTPGTGSLVTLTTGTFGCTIVKVIVNNCTTIVPDRIVISSNGPRLVVGTAPQNNYYYFDGSTLNDWPTHDPCGTNSPNQLSGVPDPGGAIYLR
jgi:fibrinogen beta/gamma subunit family protein